MPHVSDKSLHFAGFVVITAVFLLALTVRNMAAFRRVLVAVFAMALYGAFDEITQPLVNRSASWNDWFADMGGAALAVVAWELLIAMRSRLQSA